MPGRKDVTYYVTRVTWGMIMAQREKEKRKTSNHVKCFHSYAQLGIFTETNYRSIEFGKAMGTLSSPSETSLIHNNTPGKKSLHFGKENLEKEAYAEFIFVC